MSEFICARCGKPLTVRKVVINYPFNKEELRYAEQEEDFGTTMYSVEKEVIEVQCENCGRPLLNQEDAEWLSGYCAKVTYKE